MDEQSKYQGELNSKFDDFEYTPSTEVWDRIQATEEGGNGPLAVTFADFNWPPHKRVWRRIRATMHPQRRRRALVWWSAAAGIALLLGLSLLLTFRNSGQTPPSPMATNDTELTDPPGPQTQRPYTNATNPANLTDRDNNNRNSDIEAHSTAKDRGAALDRDGSLAENGAPEDRRNQDQNNDRRNVSNEGRGTQQADRRAPDELQQDKALRNATDVDAWYTRRQPKVPPSLKVFRSKLENPRVWTVKKVDGTDELDNWAELPEFRDRDKSQLYGQLGGNLTSGGIGFAGGRFAQADGLTFSPGTDPALPVAGLEASGASYSPYGVDEDFTTPIVVGVTINKKGRKRWRFGTGLTYTHMQSSSRHRREFVETRHRILRQFLGVVGNVSRDMMRRKYWQLYATTGLQADVGLTDRATREVEDLGNGNINSRELRGSPGVNLGVNVGLGANFRLTDQIGLYGQGGIATFPFRTSYSLWATRTFWPTAQFGLRLNL